MTVPKLTRNNFDDIDLSFQGAARRNICLSVISIEYLVRPNDIGNHDAVWKSREEKLNNCVIFVWQSYNNDAEILYTLLFKHVGTSGTGSNIISKIENSNNGRL